MNQPNYNQLDGRDVIAHLIEIFSPMMKAEDESAVRLLSANSYINKKVIENAGECYKQVNKSLLNFRNLSEKEKIHESNNIDSEAVRIKNEWIQKLQQKGVSII